MCGPRKPVPPRMRIVGGVGGGGAGRGPARMYRSLAELPTRTVAIVRGAQVWQNGEPSWVLRDRLEAARELYRAGKVSKILVSGDHAHASHDEVNVMHHWLVSHGVP